MIQAFYTPYFKVVLNLCLEFINHSEWIKPGWCASCLDHKPIDLSGYRDWLSPVYLTQPHSVGSIALGFLAPFLLLWKRSEERVID